ncbi:retrotransposon protein, putative, ty1-copia subclass [Tanacetum coccineum]
MVQPEGFVDPKHPNKVCKLQRSIYGLKQASRSWNKRFDEEIKKICFTQNPNEPYVYLKASGSNVAFLVLYVDDILLMGNRVTLLQEVKSWLWYTPMMEKPNYKKLQGAKTPTEVQRMQRVPYASAIGSIMYAVRCTRPDVAFAYGSCVWEDELKVSCYADASFQTDKDDTTSQIGYMFILNGGAVYWKSAKQSTNAISSIKVEYIATAEASIEAVWMRKFINGLGDVIPSNKRPIEMLYDNEHALAIASDPRILKGARYFQRKYHYIREVIQEGKFILKKVHTDDIAANPFTKLMPFNKLFEHAMAIEIVHASSLM